MTLITTTHGEMDSALLRKVEGQIDTEQECTMWVEYYIGEELVHRSVWITLKQPAVFAASAIEGF